MLSAFFRSWRSVPCQIHFRVRERRTGKGGRRWGPNSCIQQLILQFTHHREPGWSRWISRWTFQDFHFILFFSFLVSNKKLGACGWVYFPRRGFFKCLPVVKDGWILIPLKPTNHFFFLDSFGTSGGISKEAAQRLAPCSPYIVSSTPRRANATKSVSSTVPQSSDQAHKRYSLDLNTLKKLCDTKSGQEEALPPRDITSKTKSSDSEDSVQRLEFFDSFEQRPNVDDFENYWDAEDEQYDDDSY